MNIKSKAQYWKIRILFTIPWLLLWLWIGSGAEGMDDTFDKIKYYFRLEIGGEEYVYCDNSYTLNQLRIKYALRQSKKGVIDDYDKYVTFLFFTKKQPDENLINKIAENASETIEYSRINSIKTDKEQWTLYSENEVVGYAESFGGFFLKKLLLKWDKEKWKEKQRLIYERDTEKREEMIENWDRNLKEKRQQKMQKEENPPSLPLPPFLIKIR